MICVICCWFILGLSRILVRILGVYKVFIVESVLLDKFYVILISNYVVFYGMFERKGIFILSFGFY